jgi:outer membrane protein assembly complex protein YaeT
MNKRIKSFLVFIAVWILMVALGAMAQEKAVKVVEIKVAVDGETTITEKYVLDHIRLKPGDVFTPEEPDQNVLRVMTKRTNEDVVNLMKSGRFADVRVESQSVDGGVVLTYFVEGYPLLDSVAFNRKIFELQANGDMIPRTLSLGLRIKEKKLRKQIQLVKGMQYNEARRHADEKALREYYIKEGYFPVEVRGEFLKESKSVTFTIEEGERIKIDEMGFERVDGPELSFDLDDLDDYVKARERRRWYNPISWLMNDGRLKPLELGEDIDRVATYYRNRGFIDVKVSFKHSAKEAILENPEYHRLRKALLDAEGKYRATQRQLIVEEAKEQQNENLIDDLDDRLDDEEDAVDDAADDLDDFLDDNRLVKLTFLIDEGKQYKIGAVKFTYIRKAPNDIDGTKFEDVVDGDGYVPAIPRGVLLAMISMKPGEIYRPEQLEGKDDSDLKALRDAYGAKAHINATVRVIDHDNLEDKTKDLEFRVFEGPTYYVDLVKIEGNVKTKDFVIRRELAISPGEAFDLGRVEKSRRRIDGLRLFSDVQAQQQRSGEAGESNEENLLISVREQNTGRIFFGGGFGSDSGAFGHIILSQENFDIGRWRRPHFLQGGGQKIRLRVVTGGNFNNYGLDFEEPWFMGQKLRFTTSLYARELQYYSTKFDAEETGARFGLERSLFGSEFLRGNVKFTFENTGLVGVDSSASTEIKNEAGTDFISQIGAGIAYDTRGGGDLPTRGQRTSFDLNVAPDVLGSEKEFYGVHLKSAWYFKGLREEHVIELHGQAAVVDTVQDGQTVPYLYRHTLGGMRNLRGFEYREIGPRGDQGDYLGGNTMVHGTLEYSIPTPFKVIRAATFYDWGVVNKDSWEFAPGNYNDNWGVGFRMVVPFLGPLRLDYAVPITGDGFNDSGGKFNVNFGYTTSF